MTTTDFFIDELANIHTVFMSGIMSGARKWYSNGNTILNRLVYVQAPRDSLLRVCIVWFEVLVNLPHIVAAKRSRRFLILWERELGLDRLT